MISTNIGQGPPTWLRRDITHFNTRKILFSTREIDHVAGNQFASPPVSRGRSRVEVFTTWGEGRIDGPKDGRAKSYRSLRRVR